MARETTYIEALIIDYLHRNGGEGERQAVIDYMTLVEGYSEGHVSRSMQDLASDGFLGRQRSGGGRSALYNVVYDDEDDGL